MYVSHSSLRTNLGFSTGRFFSPAWRAWFVDEKRGRWGGSDEIILIDGYGLCTPDAISPRAQKACCRTANTEFCSSPYESRTAMLLRWSETRAVKVTVDSCSFFFRLRSYELHKCLVNNAVKYCPRTLQFSSTCKELKNEGENNLQLNI